MIVGDGRDDDGFSSTFTIATSVSGISDHQNNNNTKDDENYNPYNHRSVKRPNSDLSSFANLLKSSLGSGILAMPLAFKNAGLVNGVIGTIIVAIICTHCAHILVKTSYGVCKVIKAPSLGYAETCQEVFATGPKKLQNYSNFVRYTTDSAMALTYLGACCVYIVLMSASVKQLVEIFSEMTIIYPTQAYCAMFLLPLIFIVQIRNLNYLAPLSGFANVFLVTVFIISLYYVFQDLPPISEIPLYTSYTTFPSFLSTAIFAMEGIGLVMHIENSMENPSHFLGCPGVLNTSMSTVALLYGVLGFMGYWRYKEHIKGSITLNLDDDSRGAQAAKILLVIAIFFTYALQFYVTIQTLWKYVKPKLSEEWKNSLQISLRFILVIVTGIFAIAIPNLDSIIELVGAIFYSTLGLFIPALIETIFQWDKDLGKYNWILWKNLIIMLLAVVALVSGVAQAVYNMNS